LIASPRKNYYVVLSVPPTESASGIRARRRLYDHSLREAELPSRPAAEVIVSRADWPKPEPLGPEPRSLFRDYGRISPSREEVYERFARNFTRRGISKAERLQALTVDVVLSPDEALRGGVVAIAVPVLRRCSACGGSGQAFPASGAGNRGSWRKRKRSRSSFHRSLNQARSSMFRFGS
jgi:hypothetical protein